MRLSIPSSDLAGYVSRMLDRGLPDGLTDNRALARIMTSGLERVEVCFSQIHRKYYDDRGDAVFDHLNSDHMATLLYFLSNQSIRQGLDSLGFKLAYLNKVMHGIDLYPHVLLPDVFLLVHPLGTVLGRATYGNFLVVYQGVTVGSTGTEYPTLGEGTVLFSGAKVLDAADSGRNVVFGANSMVIGGMIPDNSLVVGQFPSCRVLPRAESVQRTFFHSPR